MGLHFYIYEMGRLLTTPDLTGYVQSREDNIWYSLELVRKSRRTLPCNLLPTTYLPNVVLYGKRTIRAARLALSTWLEPS